MPQLQPEAPARHHAPRPPAARPPAPPPPPVARPSLRRRSRPSRAAGPSAPLLLKVGLASDLETLTFPCCEERAGRRGRRASRVPVASSLKVEPAAAAAQQGYYRLQVAALRDERQAQDLADRLERVTGQPGEAHFDAGIDLYRVRIGRYPTREEAEADLRRLGAIGVTGAFVVNEGAAVSAPALRITQGGARRSTPAAGSRSPRSAAPACGCRASATAAACSST